MTEEIKLNYLLHPKNLKNYLIFNGDKIIFRNRTIEVKGFTAMEFIEQFDAIIFEDKNGKQARFKKETKK